MMAILILLIIFALVLFLIYISIKKEKPEENRPTIHTSGIYSVVRRSPRSAVLKDKPMVEDIEKYLSTDARSRDGQRLSLTQKEKLVTAWKEYLEKNIGTVEKGDKEGVEIYFYTFPGSGTCAAADRFRDRFVTRDQIYNRPELVPPFHLGCRCLLIADTEWKKGMMADIEFKPLLADGEVTPADWKTIEDDILR